MDETFSSNDSEQTDMAGLNVNAVSQLPLLLNNLIFLNVTSRVFFVFRPDFRKASKTFALTSPKSTTCPCRCPSSPTATPSVSDVIVGDEQVFAAGVFGCSHSGDDGDHAGER